MLERIQGPEKFGAVQGALGEDINDVLYFAGDDISAREVAVLKNRREDALR